MAITLKDGKFYKDGLPMPLEFGNKDQIKLIDGVKQLKTEGAVPTLVFDETQRFVCGLHLKCVCGSDVRIEWETEEAGYEIEGHRQRCVGCSFMYEVCSDDYNFLYLKID